MKKLFLKSMLLLCALIVGSGSVWAGEDVYYTLSTTTTGTNSSYTGNCDIAVGTSPKIITWNVTGNAQMSPWRIGGKKLTTATDRKVYSKTAMNEKITKVVFSFGSSFSTQLTVNSVKLKISTEANGGGTVLDEVTITSGFGASKSLTFTPSENKEWSVGSYYTFTFNITTDNTNTNRFLEFDSAVFYYEEASATPSSDVKFTNKTPSINYPETKTYSQAPSTATGYSGTITYAITENNAGASINTSTGEVTVTTGGSVTVKATAAAVPGSFTSSEDTYTLTVNDTRTSAELTWSAASADVTYGADNNVFPTLTNTHSVPVTYTSSNQAAATINLNTGEITLKDYKGKTIISAIFAGNDDYLPQTVTYELNVSKAPFAVKDGIFDFVEAANQNPLVDYGSGVTLTSSDYTTGDKTWTAGNVTMTTSDGGGSGIRWWSADGTLRFYNKAKATFSVPNGYVITKIVTTGANFDSASPTGLSGSTWKGAANEVELSVTATRNIKTITITYTTETQSETVQSYGWATYIPKFNVEFAANTAYVVTDASVSSGLTLEAVTEVPAGTPLLLKGAGEKTATVIASATAPTTNLLSVSNGTIADGKYAYVLAKNGEGACFKQWTGAAATLEGRVVLILDEAVSSRSTFELDDETTGISQVEASKSNVEGFYNLAGQRVANPTKGLYIVNGKKVVIK